MNISRNIGYLFLVAASIGMIFGTTSPGVLSPADARSDFCKQNPEHEACGKESKSVDKDYKCLDQAKKDDGIIDPDELAKCDRKLGE